ncbi:MAG: class I SAM-dependent methyltransferase [Planctomycetota bacterium]
MTGFNPQEYWENRLSQGFGLQQVGRINFGKCFNTWAYRIRRRVFLAVMKANCSSRTCGNILDIGSGTGFYVDRWEELRACRITGLDLTAVAVRRLARKYPQDTFYQVDIGDDLGDLKEQRFDAVSCMDVLFHVVDDQRYQRAIENIYGLLRPGGVFVFSEVFPRVRIHPSPHVQFRSRAEIEHILQTVGFEIVSRSPLLVLMGDPVDSPGLLHKAYWAMLSLMTRLEPFGLVAGALLYPIELMLVFGLSESPSTEIMLCRKPGAERS